MKKVGLLLGLGVGLFAQDSQSHGQSQSLKAWKYSVAAVGATAGLDIASSWGKYELNPVLGNGEFGKKQTLIKLGGTAGLLGVEYLIVRKHPKWAKALTWVNFSASATTGVVVWHNFTLGSR